MKCKVVGRETVNYTSKKTGKTVKGISLYVLREPTSREEGVEGLVTDKIYIKEGSVKIPPLDLSGRVEYDFGYEYDGRYSYLSSITPVTAESKGA